MLLLAASRGHTHVCRLLLDAGASPSLADKVGNDALAAADNSGFPEVVALIQEYRKSRASGGPDSDASPIADAGVSGLVERQETSTGRAPLDHLDSPRDPIEWSAGVGIVVELSAGEDALPPGSNWEPEQESALPSGTDESCQALAESIHRRITRHRAIDRDADWSDVEIVLPVLRRGDLRFSALSEDTLVWVSRLLRHGESHGWVPRHWLHFASSQAGDERDRFDLIHRLEMMLGEFGIQVEDEPIWSNIPPEEIEGDASAIHSEVLSFLDDLGPGTRDPLLSYFNDLAPLPLLDWDEERHLGRMWQEDHNPDGLRGLVEGNLRFVVKEARRFQGLGLDVQDLVSEGNLGLLEAAKRFDPGRENRFLTYAAWWIKQSIFHALAEQGGLFRLPQKVAGNVAQLNRIISDLSNDLKRAPTMDEVASEGTFSGVELDRLMAIRQTAAVLASEDDDCSWSVLDDQTAWMDPGPEEDLDKEEFAAQVQRVLAGLNRRERNIIIRHFGFDAREPETLESIGQSLAPPVSRERVRQIEERALGMIRDRKRSLLGLYLKDEPYPWPRNLTGGRLPTEDEDDTEQV